MSVKELESTYIRLIRDLQDDQFANASERVATCIELADGRRAQVTMKIETDEDMWM